MSTFFVAVIVPLVEETTRMGNRVRCLSKARVTPKSFPLFLFYAFLSSAMLAVIILWYLTTMGILSYWMVNCALCSDTRTSPAIHNGYSKDALCLQEISS